MSIQTMDRAPVSVGTAIDFRLFFQNVLATLVHITFPCDINGREIRAFISEKKTPFYVMGYSADPWGALHSGRHKIVTLKTYTVIPLTYEPSSFELSKM